MAASPDLATPESGEQELVRFASEPQTELRFGDFDGDGADDVFLSGCL